MKCDRDVRAYNAFDRCLKP